MKMKLDSLKIAMMTLAILISGEASATQITYTVDQTIGTGSVKGTITTDGHIGTLTGSNFLSWNLVLSVPGETYTLDQTNSDVLSYQSGYYGPPNSDVTATAKNIFFDFDGSDGGYLGFQQGDYTGYHYWCNATVSQGFDCFAGGQTVVPNNVFDSYQYQSLSGNTIIATAAVSAVPEPATWGMILAGFGALGSTLRRKQNVSPLRA
jgi:hypothetical protein